MSESQKDRILDALLPSVQDELAKLPEEDLTSSEALAQYAACQGQYTDEFFPESRNSVPNTLARLCLTICPVKNTCLSTHIKIEPSDLERHGFLGGSTPRDRAHIMSSKPASSAPEQVYELRQARLDRISKSKR